MGITVALTAVIIFLVYGVDKRTLTAFMGSMLGTVTTCIIGLIFTDLFKIHGAVMSYSETLLYCGYQHLNLTQIFTSGIFIGASGAMMDLLRRLYMRLFRKNLIFHGKRRQNRG